MAGRRNDFQLGYNLVVTPGASGWAYTSDFWALQRRVAASYPPLTMVIQNQVDKLKALPWRVKPKNGKKPTATTDRLNQFMSCPDGEHTLSEWIGLLIWEMQTTDTTTIYPRRDQDGAIRALQVRDGTTIKILIDDWGDRPLPPAPAYQQNIKGFPATDYTSDELIYKPRNLRIDQIYGWSPVAQILTTVSLAMSRMTQQFAFFREGSIPDAFASCPESWTTDQIKNMQMYWDAYMAGNLAARSGGLRFIPFGLKPEPFKIDPMLKQEFDEWIMRLICFQFGEAPQPFIREMTRATAETNKETADEAGIKTKIEWMKELVNFILIKYLGDSDHEFGIDLEENLAPLDAATVASTLHKGLPGDILTKNEARAIVGQDPIPGGDEIPKAVDPLELAKAQASMKPDPVPPEKGKPAPAGKPAVQKTHNHNDIHKVDDTTPEEKDFADLLETLFSAANDKARAKAKTLLDSMVAPSVDDPFLPKTWFDVLVEDATPHLQSGAKVGLQLGSTWIEEETSEAPMPVVVAAGEDGANAWAESRAAWLVGRGSDPSYRIDDLMRQAISTKVQQAVAEGWKVSRLQQELEDDFAFSPARALMIARTEKGNAARAGQMAIYTSAKVPFKEWLLADGACEKCRENAEVGIIPMDQPFPNGDSVHPNDRCGIRPKFKAAA